MSLESPILYEILTTFALACLLLGLALGREQVRSDRGLRHAFFGLLTASVAAVVLAFYPPSFFVWPFAGAMVGGMLYVIANVNVTPKNTPQSGKEGSQP
jgi:uncharacterized membrane protein